LISLLVYWKNSLVNYAFGNECPSPRDTAKNLLLSLRRRWCDVFSDDEGMVGSKTPSSGDQED